MSNNTTTEERVLSMVKRVLTNVARDTHVKPGYQHPLSDETIHGIRDCLALISSRENEIAQEKGQTQSDRPRFVDEPKTSHLVNFVKKDK